MLQQHGRDEVVAYVTMTNLRGEDGPTFPTAWELLPRPADVDLLALQAGKDGHWVEQRAMPFPEFRKASNQVRFFFPRGGQRVKSVVEQWVKLRNGERFVDGTLGYVCDMFPHIVDAYGEEVDPYQVEDGSDVEDRRRVAKTKKASFWYPTVVLNLEIKKALPPEGVDWLYCRTSAKVIRNGRLDIEVVIMDEKGELVAVSHHVTLVLSAARNLAARTRGVERAKL